MVIASTADSLLNPRNYRQKHRPVEKGGERSLVARWDLGELLTCPGSWGPNPESYFTLGRGGETGDRSGLASRMSVEMVVDGNS